MNAPQSVIDSFINAAIAFGLPIPTSVNQELKDNGYNTIEEVKILERVSQILAQRALFDALVRGEK
jgi:hypothetical protein